MANTGVFEIPLIPAPQNLGVTLNQVQYIFNIKWNNWDQVWTLDIYDQNNNLLVGGIYMVTGQNLLSPYPDLNIGGQLVVQTDNDVYALPTFTNLGVTSHLYFIPTVSS